MAPLQSASAGIIARCRSRLPVLAIVPSRRGVRHQGGCFVSTLRTDVRAGSEGDAALGPDVCHESFVRSDALSSMCQRLLDDGGGHHVLNASRSLTAPRIRIPQIATQPHPATPTQRTRVGLAALGPLYLATLYVYRIPAWRKYSLPPHTTG